MGNSTNKLIDLAHEISPNPSRRELDFITSTGEQVSAGIMALALQEIGKKAVALTGWQAGFLTESVFSNSRIITINPSRVKRHIIEGNIVIVTGFQGITEMSKDGDVSTLGRGGSDTSAVALAAALQSHTCEIYTDVDGIYTADPRIVPNAKKLDTVSYEEMLELAGVGAKVMHARAVELGSLYGLKIHVRNSHNDNIGTIITKESAMEHTNKVTGIAAESEIGVLTLVQVPDQPGIAAKIFEPLAELGINPDIIVQATSSKGETDVSFAVALSELNRAKEALEKKSEVFNAKSIQIRDDLAKVSIVGTGIRNHPSYAATMFKVLADADINIHLIGSSNIRITCIIDRDNSTKAVQLLHDAFDLVRV